MLRANKNEKMAVIIRLLVEKVYLCSDLNLDRMLEDNRAILLLKEKVETRMGRKLETPRDYDYLHEQILAASNEYVSATTLKRMMGYINDGKRARTSTLDIVCRYAGYESWADFRAKETGEAVAEKPYSPYLPQKGRRWLWPAVIAVLVIALLGIIFWLGHEVNTLSTSNNELTTEVQKLRGDRILIAGRDTFKTYQDYLRLFNIVDSQNVSLKRNVNSLNTIFKQKKEEDIWWYKELKGVPHVYVWSPQFHHPIWHNDGDSASLLPTIHEYIDSKQGDNEMEKSVIDMSVDSRLPAFKQELRITFMSNLGCDGYIFLGVYAAQQKDSHHTTWRRVARELDLDDLSTLEQLRRKVYHK